MPKLFTPSSTDLTNMVKAAEAKFDASRELDERIIAACGKAGFYVSKPGPRATEFGTHVQASTLIVMTPPSKGPETVVDLSDLRKFVQALENLNA